MKSILKSIIWNLRYLKGYNNFLNSQTEIQKNEILSEFIIKKSNNKQGDILDLGCGNGFLSKQLIFKKYTGVDISSIAIKSNKQIIKNVNFYCMPLEKFKNKYKYDIIIFNEILYYVNYKQTIHKFLKYLKRNGIIVISTYKHPETLKSWRYAKSRLNCIEESKIELNKKIWKIGIFTNKC